MDAGPVPHVARWFGLAAVAASVLNSSPAFAQTPAKPGSVRNLITDYGAGRGANPRDISGALQQAVDDAAGAGGATIVIPARAEAWSLSRPVLVDGSADITIAGEGAGTRIFGGGTLFLLGFSHDARNAPPNLADAFPSINGATNLLDDSVKDRRFGLRVRGGDEGATAYVPACPLAFGFKVPRDPSGDYWKDYAAGSGKATYWRQWPQYTLNFAVLNNASQPLSGVICGVGGGGATDGSTHGGIADPLNVWTLECDPARGGAMCFKFRVIDASGRESIQSLVLSKDPPAAGLHRISVQLDLASGKCRAWHGASASASVSASAASAEQPTLSDKLDLGQGFAMKQFEYGAFQLGPVTGRLYHGPNDANDWTCCGVSVFSALRYATGGDADAVGAVQQPADAAARLNDAYRFFPPDDDKQAIVWLPLTAPPTDGLLAYRTGHEYGGNSTGYGLWTLRHAPPPQHHTLRLRDMQLFADSSNVGLPVGIGAAEHVVLENIYEGGGGFSGVSSLPISGLDRTLTLKNCRLVGSDSAVFAFDQQLDAQNVTGGGGNSFARLVGCRGRLEAVIITSFVACDYYAKLHAGPHGGAMRFGQFCIDNEGMEWAPKKACFYAEPAIDPEGKPTVVSFPGTIYTGALLANQAVVELADPPGGGRGAGVVQIDGVDLYVDPKKPARCIVLSHSDQWTGAIRLAQTSWASVLTRGLIESTSPGPCRIVSYHDDAMALPTSGSWLTGCHIFHIPDHIDPATGAWVFKTYRCGEGGVYGTQHEPRWEVQP